MLLALSRLWAAWNKTVDEGGTGVVAGDGTKISVRLWNREDEISPVPQGLDEPEPTAVLWLYYGNRGLVYGSSEAIPSAVEEEENATFLTLLAARLSKDGTRIQSLSMLMEPMTLTTIVSGSARRRLISVNTPTDTGLIT